MFQEILQGGSGGGSGMIKTLWTGDLSVVNSEIILSENVDNFEAIQIDFYMTGDGDSRLSSVVLSKNVIDTQKSHYDDTTSKTCTMSMFANINWYAWLAVKIKDNKLKIFEIMNGSSVSCIGIVAVHGIKC